ncbi:MAG: nitrogen regulation protein NR(II) [Vicinamibacterales bacterium]
MAPNPTPAGHRFDFSTLDLLPYGIIVVDTSGTVLYYNEREEQISRRDRTEVVGRNFFTEIAPCTRVQAFHGRFEDLIRRGAGAARFAFHFPLAHGPRDVEITMTPFEHEGSRLCMIAVNDITAQDEVRSQVLESERFRDIGEVAARVAHNFGNLLQVIVGSTEMLLTRTDLPPDAMHRIKAIRTAGEDGTALVGRVRSLMAHRTPAVPFEPIDLAVVATQAGAWAMDFAARHAAESGTAPVPVAVEAGAPAWAFAAASEIRELLLNLLKNAVEATRASGQVTIRVEPGPARHTVVVEDTGMGMSAATLSRLFRPFFTTKGRKGTGFGLATAYTIAQAHGGQLAVDSVEGKGTRFHLRLPALAPPD